MIKTGIFILSFFTTTISFAQDNGLRKYFDTSWKPVPKDAAFYYADFIPERNIYKVTTYYAGSGKLHGKSTFADTLLVKGIGLRLAYYETGELKDSGFFNAKGYVGNQYNFKKNGKLETHVFTNPAMTVTRIEEYDENGKLNPKATVVLVAAEFEGGIPAWAAYLERHLKVNVPVKNKAPVGKYSVIVSFVINKEGKVEEVTAENDPGFGTKEEAVRVIEDSPKWRPATQNGVPVIYRHKQSITFQVTEK